MATRRLENNSGNIVVIALFIILIVATAGWIVYRNHHKAIVPTKTNNSSITLTHNTAQPSQPADPTAGWATYTSKVGNFSFKYPSSWYIAGGGTGPSYGEISLEPQTSQTSTHNAFRMTLWVVSSPATISGQAAQGTTQTLTNEITIWQQNQADATTSVGVCPSLRLLAKDQNNYYFNYALSGGQYLTLNAGYCQGEKDTTSYTYQQQLSSQEWQDAIYIVGSIKVQ